MISPIDELVAPRCRTVASLFSLILLSHRSLLLVEICVSFLLVVRISTSSQSNLARTMMVERSSTIGS